MKIILFTKLLSLFFSRQFAKDLFDSGAWKRGAAEIGQRKLDERKKPKCFEFRQKTNHFLDQKREKIVRPLVFGGFFGGVH